MDSFFKSHSNLIASSHEKFISAWEILKVLFGSERVKKIPNSYSLCVT